ncbi:MAG: choice-of-anchor Q domain-containing protein [Thermoanaerobaculia bacterium]
MPHRAGRFRLAGSLIVCVASAPGGVLAATFVVTSIGDAHDAVIDGVCDTGGGVCTLRAAIEEANAQVSPDPRVLLPALTISLALGELPITRAMTIEGAGAAASIVQPLGAPNARCLHHTAGALTLRGITIRGFRLATGSLGLGAGTAIYSQAPLTLERCAFDDNRSPDGAGGAVVAISSLVATDGSFTRNSAYSTGALFANAQATLARLRFEGNSATELAGAVSFAAAPARVEESYFADNQGKDGGAIALFPEADLAVVNSTFRHNLATRNGGGIALFSDLGVDPGLRLFNTTFALNEAESDRSGSGAGGAIYNGQSSSSNVQLYDSILADNAEQVFFDPFWVRVPQECRGPVASNGYNIVQYNDGGCSIAGATQAVDPLLQPAAYNGGATPTLALAANSPAVGAGNPTAVGGCIDDFGAPIPADQRGSIRPYGVDCDLGAFEWGSLTFSDDFEGGDLSRWSARSP